MVYSDGFYYRNDGYGGNDIPSVQQTQDGYFIFRGINAGTLLKIDHRGQLVWKDWLSLFTDHSDIDIFDIFVRPGLNWSKPPLFMAVASDGSHLLTHSDWSDCETKIVKLKFTSDTKSTWEGVYKKTNALDICPRYSALQETDDGGYTVLEINNDNTWVSKLDENGMVDWQREYKIAGARSIEITSDGGYILAGAANDIEGIRQLEKPADSDSRDGWILKLDPDGTIAWFKVYGGEHDDWIDFIQETDKGSYIAVGRTNSFDDDVRSQDLWVLKLDSRGDVLGCPILHQGNTPIASFVEAKPTQTRHQLTDQHPSEIPIKEEDANFSSKNMSLQIEIICD